MCESSFQAGKGWGEEGEGGRREEGRRGMTEIGRGWECVRARRASRKRDGEGEEGRGVGIEGGPSETAE